MRGRRGGAWLLLLSSLSQWCLVYSQLVCRTCVNQLRISSNVPWPTGTCVKLTQALGSVSPSTSAFVCDPYFSTYNNGLGVTACTDLEFSQLQSLWTLLATTYKADQLRAMAGLQCGDTEVADEIQLYSTCGFPLVVKGKCEQGTQWFPPIVPSAPSMCTTCVNQLRRSAVPAFPAGTCDQLALNLFDIAGVQALFTCGYTSVTPFGVTACSTMDVYTNTLFMAGVATNAETLIRKQNLQCMPYGPDELQIYSTCAAGFSLPASPYCPVPPVPVVWPMPPPPPPAFRFSPPPPPPVPMASPPPPPVGYPICNLCMMYIRDVNPNWFSPMDCDGFAAVTNQNMARFLARDQSPGFTCSPGFSLPGRTMAICTTFRLPGASRRFMANFLTPQANVYFTIYSGVCGGGRTDRLYLNPAPNAANEDCGGSKWFRPPGCARLGI